MTCGDDGPLAGGFDFIFFFLFLSSSVVIVNF